MVRYLLKGSARRTMSAQAATSAEVAATAPGMRTSTIKDMLSGPRELEITTLYPAFSASRAMAVPARPAPRMPRTLAFVCVTFGSMVNKESGRILDLARAALARTHQRGIILAGWGGTPPEDQNADLLHLDAAPHDWLFPRCRTVIHHGGVGTTAAGLRAGIPNIVIPHGIDQKFWGRRITALGAGPAAIDLARLSIGTLSAALVKANFAALRSRAQEVGRVIRSEDGVGQAVRLVEEHVAQARAKRA